MRLLGIVKNLLRFPRLVERTAEVPPERHVKVILSYKAEVLNCWRHAQRKMIDLRSNNLIFFKRSVYRGKAYDS